MNAFEKPLLLWQRFVRKGCLPLVAAAVFLPFLALVGLYIQAKRLPTEAPLAQMYRAEVTVKALARAVEIYHQQYQAYPPPGTEGLRLAVQSTYRRTPYFGNDLPVDPWGNPFRYVPHTHYAASPHDALAEQGAFFAPDTFQLYSVGADGESGASVASHMRDNITSWDASRPWRSVYKELTREFLRKQKEPANAPVPALPR